MPSLVFCYLIDVEDNDVFYFNKELIPLLIFGSVSILAVPILIILRKINPRSFSGIAQCLMFISLGIFVFYLFFSACRDDKYLIDLLEQGRITEGRILEIRRSKAKGYPWEILYSFEVPNPKDGKLRIYNGNTIGHLSYYRLSNRDIITIIYNPTRPEINYEINKYLNYRGFFEKAGKLKLFEEFRDKNKDKFKNSRLLQWEE